MSLNTDRIPNGNVVSAMIDGGLMHTDGSTAVLSSNLIYRNNTGNEVSGAAFSGSDAAYPVTQATCGPLASSTVVYTNIRFGFAPDILSTIGNNIINLTTFLTTEDITIQVRKNNVTVHSVVIPSGSAYQNVFYEGDATRVTFTNSDTFSVHASASSTDSGVALHSAYVNYLV